MTRSLASSAALVTVLAVVMADSTASAQMCGYSPYRIAYNPYNDFLHPYNGRLQGSRVPRCGTSLADQQTTGQTPYNKSVKQVEDYFERKLRNIEYRYMLKPALIRARLSRDREIANIKEEFADTIEMNRRRAEELARRLAPKRLAESGYNSVAGVVLWPPLFRDYHRFAEDRAWIDTMFAQRTPYNSGALSRNCLEVRRAAERMKLTLGAMHGELDGTTYMAAKRFLESVAYEARFAVDPTAAKLAAN